ncbi:MAG: ZIP family metal transporter [Hyphomonas sp.]
MLQSLQAPLLFSLVAALITTAGLLTVYFRGDWSARHSGLFALAAGGMLLTLSLIHIAPESMHLSRHAPIFLAVGFYAGLLLEKGITTALPETADIARAAAITPLAAVAVHSFMDGMIYAVTFAGNFTAGVYAALSLMLHEYPEGIIAFAILRRHSFSNRESFFWAFLAAGVTTPLAVVVTGPFLHGLTPDLIGGLFALSAGLLLFVATGPLMQPLQEEKPVRGFLALGGGVALAVLMTLLPLHGEATGGGHGARHHRGGPVRRLLPRQSPVSSRQSSRDAPQALTFAHPQDEFCAGGSGMDPALCPGTLARLDRCGRHAGREKDTSGNELEDTVKLDRTPLQETAAFYTSASASSTSCPRAWTISCSYWPCSWRARRCAAAVADIGLHRGPHCYAGPDRGGFHRAAGRCGRAADRADHRLGGIREHHFQGHAALAASARLRLRPDPRHGLRRGVR